MSYITNFTLQAPLHSQLRSAHPSTCEYDPIRDTPSVKPNTTLQPLSLSTHFRTTSSRSDFQHQGKLNTHCLDETIAGTFYLPVVVRRSGTFSRCVWDGGVLKLVSIDGGNANSFWGFALNFEDGVRVLGRVFGDAVRDFFLPRKVSENYLEYVKWKFFHRVFSSALQVLATQAMFRAIGIGYSRSLPSAAALNWVLKDGLGRLSRCIYTASLASAFDTNLKRIRFATSVLFSLSIGVELLTPVFPKHFLLLATIANIAKQISLSCYIATSSAVHRSFAIADNLGEVSAKAQIQTVCFDIIGLLVAASINILVRNNQRLLATLPFALYPLFSAADLIGIYQGLKHVHLQTLTKDRLEMIIKIWIQYGYVPSPAEVSKREGVNFLWCKDREILPIRIGCLSSKSKMLKLSFMTLKSLKDVDFSFICIESFHKRSRISELQLLLSLREGAGTDDVILGLLQACYIRERLLHDTMDWEKGLEIGDSSWSMLMEESKRCAQNDVNVMVDTMLGLGWACKNVLLSTQEQERYRFVAN